MWVCTNKGGAYLFKNADLKSIPIHFLTSLSVSSVMVDREGSVWVCTLEKGLFQSMNKNVLYINEPNLKVVDFQKKSNKIYVSFYPKNFLSVSGNDPVLPENNDIKRLPASCTLGHFYKNDPGKYSYYETNEGVFYVDDKSVSIIGVNAEKIFAAKLFLEIAKDTFIFINTHCLYIINREKIVKKIMFPFSVNCVTQLKNKTILIGSRSDNGIYELKNNSYVPYLNNLPQLKTRINWMTEDSDGDLWIATNEKGLYCYSAEKKLYGFNQKNTSIPDKVNTITIDAKNNIWIGTNKGISEINYSKGLQNPLVSNFNRSHGIPDLEIDKIIEFNGKIWCKGQEYVYYFECNKMQKNTVSPLCYIKSFAVNNKECKLNDSSVFNYNENNISFKFETISYKNFNKNECLYQLKGYDDTEHYSNTGEVQYTNLGYGTYTFIVYGLNNDRIKSDKPACITFTIKRPFWFTWWFVLFEIILLSYVVYFIASSWMKKIKMREEQKTVINQQMAEFQMRAVRAQMNPHFIFNALSSIQHFILKNDAYQSYDYLSKFSRLIRNVLDNSEKEYITLEQEISTLKLYIELEQIRFKEAFEFTISVDKDLDLGNIYIPTMLIQPYIENAIWHGLTLKQSDGRLFLGFKNENNNLQITIKDNGIGRDQSLAFKKNKEHVSQGMLLIQQRLRALEIKNGTPFSVTITDLKDDKFNAIGTEVKVVIALIYD